MYPLRLLLFSLMELHMVNILASYQGKEYHLSSPRSYTSCLIFAVSAFGNEIGWLEGWMDGWMIGRGMNGWIDDR